jgi:hypothetical protein
MLPWFDSCNVGKFEFCAHNSLQTCFRFTLLLLWLTTEMFILLLLSCNKIKTEYVLPCVIVLLCGPFLSVLSLLSGEENVWTKEKGKGLSSYVLFSYHSTSCWFILTPSTGVDSYTEISISFRNWCPSVARTCNLLVIIDVPTM